MYCPKCSQQQSSEEMQFCSRCGFRLNVVKALVESDDLLPDPEFQKADRTLRKRDMTVGALFMFIFAMIAALITIDMSGSAPLVFLIGAWILLSGLIYIKPLTDFLFKGVTFQPHDIEKVRRPASFKAPQEQNALPSATAIPARVFVAPNIDTAEFDTPASITESTTKLLERK